MNTQPFGITRFQKVAMQRNARSWDSEGGNAEQSGNWRLFSWARGFGMKGNVRHGELWKKQGKTLPDLEMSPGFEVRIAKPLGAVQFEDVAIPGIWEMGHIIQFSAA